MKKEKELIES